MKPTRTVLGSAVPLLAAMALLLLSLPAQANRYVGSEICGDCHIEEYENFTKFAKKAHSSRSIKLMASDLTEEELQTCYDCHTTGHGEPGGFVSFEKTPEMSDAGCEVCHGPGQEHVDYGGDPAAIKGDLTIEGCETCHNEERVSNFDFKPMLYGGAH